MSCPFAEYSNILGEPNKGIHSVRLLDVAILDVIGTVFGAGLISYSFNYKFWKVLMILFIMGIILHWMFCVNTTVNKWIFGIV
jgi:hypothetical protein